MRPVKLEALSPTLDESFVWRAVTPSPSSSETDAASKSKPARVFSARQDGSKREDDVSGETRELAFRFGSEKKICLRARPDGFLGPRARFREGFGKFAV
jgi:hypothetical protein